MSPVFNFTIFLLEGTGVVILPTPVKGPSSYKWVKVIIDPDPPAAVPINPIDSPLGNSEPY